MKFNTLVIGSGLVAERVSTEAVQAGRSVALVSPTPLQIPYRHAWDWAAPGILRQVMRQVLQVVRPVSRQQATVPTEQALTLVRTALDSVIRSERLRWSGANDPASIPQPVCIPRYRGELHLLDEHRLAVNHNSETRLLEGDQIRIALGLETRRFPHVSADGRDIMTIEHLLQRDRLPSSMVIVGCGEIGLDAAFLLSIFGARVTVVDREPQLFLQASAGSGDILIQQARRLGVRFRLGVPCVNIRRREPGVVIELANGEILTADSALLAVGRCPVTRGLKLETAGLRWTPDGCLLGRQDSVSVSGTSRRERRSNRRRRPALTIYRETTGGWE